MNKLLLALLTLNFIAPTTWADEELDSTTVYSCEVKVEHHLDYGFTAGYLSEAPTSSAEATSADKITAIQKAFQKVVADDYCKLANNLPAKPKNDGSWSVTGIDHESGEEYLIANCCYDCVSIPR